MTKIICGLLTAVFICMPWEAFPDADGPDFWQVRGVAENDVLNIRAKPDWRSQKIGEIPPDGKCVKHLKCVGGLTLEEHATLTDAEKKAIKKRRPRWCLIEYRGTRGWVAGRYLMEGSCREESAP
jgi:hypothetical protein